MNPIPIEFQSLFRYDERWQILICLTCKHAVTKKALKIHLREIHSLKMKEYSPLLLAVSSLPTIENSNDFPIPLHDSSPVDGLAISTGFKCNNCEEMSSVSKSHVSTHVFNKHPGVRTSTDPGYRQVSLQSWSRRGKYWTVIDPNSTFRLTAEANAMIMSEKVDISWEEKIVRMETARFEE